MTHRSDCLGRRDFLRTASAALLGPAFAHPVWAELATLPRVPGNTRVLHICSYAHVDVAWLWPWRDSADEAIRTIQSATDRLTETPDLRYSQSSAAYYRWIEETDPRLFEIVKRDVASGRFEVINGWIVEPDCNIPATESIVRQSLYGKRYFKSRFGVEVVVGANPDSFGHAAGLSQLLRGAGYKYYCFVHPGAQEMPGMPIVFQWEAPDGSRVLSGRLEGGYDDEYGHGRNIAEEAAHAFQPGLDHGMYWIGIGDHGGGPTKKVIAHVIALGSDPKLPELRFSTVQDFFSAVEQSRGYAALPVVRTESQHYGAAIARKVDGSEESMQDWVAVEGTIGGHLYTLAVMNGQSYAYDCLRGLLRITLIRSVPFADWSGDGGLGDGPLVPNAARNFWMGQGRQERQFWITTSSGPHRALHLDRLAEEWQSPAETVMDSHHPGTAPRHASYLDVEPSSVWVTAVKRAEDGDALIVRFQERAGVATNATVRSEAFGWRHDVKLGPWEVATLRIDSASTSGARSTAVTFLETTEFYCAAHATASLRPNLCSVAHRRRGMVVRARLCAVFQPLVRMASAGIRTATQNQDPV